MTSNRIITILAALMLIASTLYGNSAYAAAKSGEIAVYDESAYTEYVEKTMKKLDSLYLQFCGTCNVDAAKAAKARKEYYSTVRELLEGMNARFDKLDPKKGAALSSTEVLVNIHVLTMLVDILTATQMEAMADNPHN
jgi:phosphoribosylformylglycinamidine (FGAM) synthase-like enzyme